MTPSFAVATRLPLRREDELKLVLKLQLQHVPTSVRKLEGGASLLGGAQTHPHFGPKHKHRNVVPFERRHGTRPLGPTA